MVVQKQSILKIGYNKNVSYIAKKDEGGTASNNTLIQFFERLSGLV